MSEVFYWSGVVLWFMGGACFTFLIILNLMLKAFVDAETLFVVVKTLARKTNNAGGEK